MEISDRRLMVNLEDYLTHMEKETTWGDGVMLSAASLHYNRTIRIMAEELDRQIVINNDSADVTAEPIILGYMGATHKHDHYVSLVQVSEAAESTDKPIVSDQNSTILLTEPVHGEEVFKVDTDNLKSANYIDSDAFSSETIHPQCWTVEQYNYFKKTYPWLYFNVGHMGCSICKSVHHLGQYREGSCKVNLSK